MTELLNARPQAILLAIVLAIVIDVARRLLRLVGTGARRFWNGPEPGGAKLAWYAELASYLLFPLLAFISFVPPLVLIVGVAKLMGFESNVQVSMLNHGLALLWLLTITFLAVQIWYLMRLPGFWRRLRYLLILVSLPLLIQVLIWLLLDLAFRYRLANAADLGLAGSIGHLFALGIFPFLVPMVHGRIVVPVLTFATNETRHRWRPAIIATGCAVLVGFVAATFAWFGEVQKTTLFARNEPGTTPATTAPAAIGIPHTCHNYYPDMSLRLHETGTTVLAFRITAGGTIKDIAVDQSSGSSRLDLASVVCASHWTYIPATVNGHRVETAWRTQVAWKMDQS